MGRNIRLWAVLAGFGLAASAWACQVPVFRFALERWYPDPYRLTAIPGKAGSLSAEETAVMAALTNAGDPEGMSANVYVTPEPKPESPAAKEVPAVIKGQNNAAAARLELRYPEMFRGVQLPPLWSGDVTRENARRILDSPARRELAKRLLAGESVVWVLVESGNKEADRQAEETLRTTADEVKKEMQISDEVVPREAVERGDAGLPVDPENLLRATVPLKIDFSVLRIARSDPQEQVFLAMLLHLEEDLAKLADQPMVFPVFGRGRVLEPIVGAGIRRDNLFDYAFYLCGACSCQVKEQNPGMDLLISANWEAAIDGSEVVIDKVLPPLEGIGALLGEPAASTPAPAALAAEVPAAQGASRSLKFPAMLAAALGAALLVIALGTVVLLLRARRGAS